MDYLKRKQLQGILKKVNSWSASMSALTDEALQAKTEEFRLRLAQGETLDDLLPEAFAVVKEADKRVLGMYPYDVQVLGAIVLHQGDVAEMSTGEGKTLTATMPVYLNALEGKGVMVVTTNTYLAQRDAQEMGQVYRFLGLTVGVPVTDDEKGYTAGQKRAIYQSDIVYTVNSALGFDYLGENLSDSVKDQFLPDFNYIIIDEIDAILLDSAQTPLIISGSPRVQSNLYHIVDTFILTLEAGRDYKFDEDKRQVWLTREGVRTAEAFFGVGHLYDPKHKELVRHISLALQAHKLYIKDKDYVLAPNDKGEQEVTLVDRSTGRLLELTRLQGGLHQAIEAKEHVPLTQETRAMASITYQNLFKMFPKIAGMTGTGKVAEDELLDTYHLRVVQIPTNRKKIRKDLPDRIYRTLAEKIFASLEYVKEWHEKGNPILVFTGSVEMSIIYSNLLLREGIAHNLLNANNAAREAQIISESGQMGAVTVATSMAGRGTDIKLGPGVAELGGLIVVGTERMTSQRVDLQIRGRSGRQGDPGLSQFFVSLEDDIMKDWGPRWVQDQYARYDVEGVSSQPRELKKRKYKKLVERAQGASESSGRSMRQMTLEYAESMNIQRQLIYQERDQLIKKNRRLDEEVEETIAAVIQGVLSKPEYEDPAAFYRYILDNFSYRVANDQVQAHMGSLQDKEALLWELAEQELAQKEAILKEDTIVAHFHRVSFLKAIDENWVEQVDYLQQLRAAISSQYASQQNPIIGFFQEAHESFDRMKDLAKEQMVRNLLLSTVEVNKEGELVLHFP
ncbi:accessory Sec system translocase SecA2 [Streptococcus sp. DD13]|uniref:accessory Sec system translocase SecA2 n=1 Tax=Streptococcus sp. DD13 TaxID=1777881 RepID=UPI0007936E87|nr:accessory Sec system translocase SecA2 [Streptococcus sp. DD13]KXT77738.1 Protein export cytoplasm protein SecA2 ATPase RNA helicase [Streptococcus sp. DD13]